jgi:hypothetical protein
MFIIWIKFPFFEFDLFQILFQDRLIITRIKNGFLLGNLDEIS